MWEEACPSWGRILHFKDGVAKYETRETWPTEVDPTGYLTALLDCGLLINCDFGIH